MKYKWIIGICIGIVMVGGIVTYGVGKKSMDNIIPVSILVEEMDIVSKVYISGTMLSQNERKINYNGTGVVKEIKVKEGDLVKEGDILAILDSDELMNTIRTKEIQLEIEQESLKQIILDGNINAINSLENAKSHFNETEINFNKHTKLYENAVISVSTYEKEQFQYEQAKIALDTAEKIVANSTLNSRLTSQQKAIERLGEELAYNKRQLDKTVLKSPINGTVTEIKLKSGEAFERSNYMIMIQDFNQMLIEANISEAEINGIEEGMEVVVTSNSAKNKEFKGHVYSIDSGTKTIEGKKQAYVGIKIKLDEETDGIRHQFTTNLEIKTAEKKMAKVTKHEALYTDLTGRKYVLLQKNGETKKVDVNVGIESDMYLELISDVIEVGDTLVNEIEESTGGALEFLEEM